MADSPLRPLTQLPIPILPSVPPKKGSILFQMNTPTSTSRNVTVIDLEDDTFPEKTVCIPSSGNSSTTTPKTVNKSKHKSSRATGTDGHSVTPQRNSLHNYFQAQNSLKRNHFNTNSLTEHHGNPLAAASQPIQIIDSSEDEVISLTSNSSLKSSPAPERPAAMVSSTRSSPAPLAKNTPGKRTDLRDYLQPGVPKLPPISDDLDPILLPFSAPLPKFKEFVVPEDDLHLTMNEWAQLMVIHDFFYKFSADILNMKPEDYSYEVLEDLICNTSAINRDGIQYICNLIEFIESEEHYQDSPQLPSVNSVNFQWYISEILPDKMNVFATTEFPAIPPRDRLKALSYLIDLAMDTDQFSQYLHTGVDERMSQLKKEKRERTDARRQLETQISDLTRNIQVAEKSIAEAQEQMIRLAKSHASNEDSEEDDGEDSETGGEMQSTSHDEDTSEVQEKHKPRDERTSRQRMLAEEKSRKKLVATLKGKCTKLTKDIEKMIRQRESKRKSISDLNTKDLTHQSQVEAVSSKYRGGIIPNRGSVPTSQEILLIGYDRYSRAYWHWKPIGGLIIEEHEYPEKTEKSNLAKNENEQASSNEVEDKDHKVNYDYRKPKTKWYYMDDSRQLLLLIRPLNNRGIREKSLRSMLTSMRPLFISSLEKFRKWLKREIGQSYERSEISPVADVTGAKPESNQPLVTPEATLEDESTKDKVTESEVEMESENIQDNSLDSVSKENSKKPCNSVDPALYMNSLKDTIHNQIDQLASLLFIMIKKPQPPKINLDSTVEEYLAHVKFLFAQVNNISDNHLTKLSVDSKKRARWLRTTNFQEDFDENIKTFSSLNVNLEMCIKDIENFGQSENEPKEDELQETPTTKQERLVNLRDRKSRNKTVKEDVHNSESEDEIAIQRKSNRRTHRIIQDDHKPSDSKSPKDSHSEDVGLPDKGRKLRARNTKIETEPATKRESLSTRQTRNSLSKRSRDEEADDTDGSEPKRKLRPRKDITYNATIDLHES